jgi:hypothetical protein
MSSRDQPRMPCWVPYIWLAYLTFFLWQPIAGPTGGKQWLATGLALVVFLFFYFTFSERALRGRSDGSGESSLA